MNNHHLEHPRIWLITLVFPHVIALIDEDLAVELVNDDIQHTTNLSRVVLHEVVRFHKSLQIFIEGMDSDARDLAQMLAANLPCKATFIRHGAL